MHELTNTIANNVLAAFSGQASKSVMNAIQSASAKTGVDFAYLMQQAKAESSFDPHAKARTSSATGLYQFIESTWLNTIEKHGYKHGISLEGKSRRQILNMRNDPEIAANMAAEFASENQKFLEDHWAKGEKDIGATELYLAHFLGAGGAAGFLNARDENPLQKAAYIFPEAAKANRNVFYEAGTSRPRTMDEIYAFFDKKFQIEGAPAPQAQPSAKSTPHSVVYQDIASEALLAFGVENSGFEYSRRSQDHLINRLFSRGHQELENIYGQHTASSPYQALLHAPIEIMLLAELDLPTNPDITRHKSYL
ncbi:MAG TPA: transglycosylase SLT domain-containing protein [Alphaproteobacteria bacterium]|nr:transglycosylase SLT domain-containing protein [Alphaproteobacteria bacterium]USO04915.1 MAG: transglycosylase SLT domain-containing protein [Rhodospirillales bacterium]HOO82576.1 transglycosylase SLT domain-containing protein [Alphaproteobacteria bacterium]